MCKLKFTYGLVDNSEYGGEGNKSYSDDEIKDILKYNAQDYSSTMSGNNKVVTESYKRKIIRSGKGCSQIYLAIDCSNSMTEGDDGTPNIEIIKEAAKQLVEGLLTPDQDSLENNIYIGVIGFSQYSVRRLGLSKDINAIEEAIDKIDDLSNETNENGLPVSYGSGTNIGAIFDKANEEFANTDPDTSNRTVILLSDGAPTIYENVKVYADDSNSEKISKARRVTELTREKMQEERENGLKILTVIPEDDDELTNELVDKLLENEEDTSYRPNREDTETIANTIKDDLRSKIEETLVNVDVSTVERGDEFTSADDADRRKEVNDLYETIDNSTVINFDKALDKPRSQEAKDMSENLHMYTFSKPYEIGMIEDLHINMSNLLNQDPNEKEEEIEKSDHGYINQNLALTLRDVSNIQLEEKVTGVRITLADGRVITGNGDITNHKTDADLDIDDIIQVDDVGNGLGYYMKYLDKELMQGATLEIEYTTVVKNTSPIQMKDFTLIDYLPDDLTFNANSKLISEDHTNEDYNWEMSTTSGKNVAKANWQNMNDEVMRKDILGNNGERYIKLVLSRLITTEGNENTNYTNQVELFDYSNVDGRIMGNIETEEEQITDEETGEEKDIEIIKNIKRDIIPFNYLEHADAALFEADENGSIEVIIIPPTGTLEYYMNLALAVIIFAIIVFIAIAYRMKQDEKLEKDLKYKLK